MLIDAHVSAYKKSWIMYLIGDRDRCIGRCIGRYIDRYSTVYRSILDRVSVDTRPSVDRCIDWYIGRYSYRSIYMVVHRYFTDTLPILHRDFTDTSLILHRYFIFTKCIGWYRSIYLVNKPLQAAGMSADNVRGWEIVRKMNIWPRSEASRANVKFWGQSLSQGHYQPTYQQARKGFIYFVTLPLIFISQN